MTTPPTLEEHIASMCASNDTRSADIGRLLRHLDSLHVRREDDGLCDSDGTAWPCWTSLQIMKLALQFGPAES